MNIPALALNFLITLCLFCFLPGTSTAAAATDGPILRIEDEMDHAAPISRVAADSEGRLIFTASHDKTIRVWDVSKGRKLLRIVRPPIGHGLEGKLLALAVSPDGSMIACGGYTGYDWDKAYSIYLFDSQTGRMVNRIGGLPNIICQLAFSKDGRLLAAGLGGKGGLRVYNVAKNSMAVSSTLVSQDTDYGDHVFGADFDGSGRLVTGSFDGYVRLYDTEHRLAFRTRVTEGSSPHQVSFSPGGEKIAVGFNDVGLLVVLSGRDLSRLYSPDTQTGTQERKTGDFACVAWSSDGRFLYGGGRYSLVKDGRLKTYIRKWPEAGLGPYFDIVTAGNSIQHIIPLKTGGLVFGASDATWGFVDHKGRENRSGYWGGQLLSDFRSSDSGDFLVSRDGSVVQYGYTMDAKRLAMFSIYDRTVEYDKELRPYDSPHAMKPPQTRVGAMTVTGWKNEKPLLNGRPLKMGPNEISRCAAVSPDGKTALIGTDWNIYFFDGRGNQSQKIPVPAVAWKINISGDGRYAVAALGDGTIRWYGMKDGREECVYFPLGSQRQWVLWIPEGYFDASLEGGKYFAYHLNQGKDKEGRIIPVSLLYDVFYRPDILALKFRGESIKDISSLTVDQALQSPPPTVSFNYPPFVTDKSTFKVCYEAAAKEGGVGDVRLFHNGKLVRSDGYYRSLDIGAKTNVGLKDRDSGAIYRESRGLAIVGKGASPVTSNAKGQLFQECLELDSVSGPNEVGLVAFNETNTVQSFMATHKVESTYREPEPRLYILAVGIDRYRDSKIDLKFAAKDARDFVGRAAERMSSLYPPERIEKVLLTDSGAGKQGILAAVEGLAKKIKPADHFVLFIASHGIIMGEQYHIVTSDYAGRIDGESLISSNEIVDISKRIKSLKQLYIFDTCYAGGVDRLIMGLYDARISVLAKKMGLHIYASASSSQQAMDGYEGNGLFTHVLLEGFGAGKGVDRDGDGKVTVTELGEFTKKRVGEIAKQVGHVQLPVTISFGSDWAVYSVTR